MLADTQQMCVCTWQNRVENTAVGGKAREKTNLRQNPRIATLICFQAAFWMLKMFGFNVVIVRLLLFVCYLCYHVT